jgi:oligopeptide/dipeptide ABC transporter ATP-binding protein
LPLLQIENLTKCFGRTDPPAVDGVNLSVSQGETVGLVGESGCGKTTLSRCILRLETQSAGKVLFDGADLAAIGPRAMRAMRREMQIVFQDPYGSLDPRWTIERIVAEPLAAHGIGKASGRRADCERLLSSVGLPASALPRYPHEFSGGQRQRIGIARALASKPRLLIADEPVSALDVSVRAQVLGLLMDAQRERNLAMLFIAHDLGVVRQVSRRVAVMFRGQIVEESPTDALFDNPRHPYTRALLAAIPSARRRAALRTSNPETSPAAVMTSTAPTGGCRYRDRCAYAKDICAQQAPPEVVTGEGRFSRCHFALELPAAR